MWVRNGHMQTLTKICSLSSLRVVTSRSSGNSQGGGALSLEQIRLTGIYIDMTGYEIFKVYHCLITDLNFMLFEQEHIFVS